MPNFFNYGIYNILKPARGVKVVPVQLDFTGGNNFLVDMTQAVDLGEIDYVQSVYIDNAAGAGLVSIQASITQQKIYARAGHEVYLPIFSPNPPIFNCFNTVAGGVVNAFFCNAPISPLVARAV